jgi:hypothetical protein
VEVTDDFAHVLLVRCGSVAVAQERDDTASGLMADRFSTVLVLTDRLGLIGLQPTLQLQGGHV